MLWLLLSRLQFVEAVEPGLVGLFPVILSINVNPAIVAVAVALPVLVPMPPQWRCWWFRVSWGGLRGRSVITNIWPMLLLQSYGP